MARKENYQDVVSRVQQERGGRGTTNCSPRIIPQQSPAQHQASRNGMTPDQLQKRMAVGGYYTNIM